MSTCALAAGEPSTFTTVPSMRPKASRFTGTTSGTSTTSPGREMVACALPMPTTPGFWASRRKNPTEAPGKEKLPSAALVVIKPRLWPEGSCWLKVTRQPLSGASVPAATTVPRTTDIESSVTLRWLTSCRLTKTCPEAEPRLAVTGSNTSTVKGPTGIAS